MSFVMQSFGALTLEQNKRKELATIDDDTSIISSLFSNTPETSAFNDGGSGSPSTDLSELSADEPLDIFALDTRPAAAGASSAQASEAGGDWKMLVADSGKVYYWNKATNTTSWQRPEGFLVTEDEKSKAEQEASRLLDKTVEDTSDLFFNNADGALDSYKTVRIDEDGYPVQDRFTYVDEETCIGCTNCATVARSTFFMEDELGRARVFRQGGDSDELIAEVGSTRSLPFGVDCDNASGGRAVALTHTLAVILGLNRCLPLALAGSLSSWHGMQYKGCEFRLTGSNVCAGGRHLPGGLHLVCILGRSGDSRNRAQVQGDQQPSSPCRRVQH